MCLVAQKQVLTAWEQLESTSRRLRAEEANLSFTVPAGSPRRAAVSRSDAEARRRDFGDLCKITFSAGRLLAEERTLI